MVAKQNPQKAMDLSGSDRNYLRCVAELLGRHIRAPVDGSEIVRLFLEMGYMVNDRIIELVAGRKRERYSVSDLRQLHITLDERKLWLKFPNPIHDFRKASGVLALEIADAWPKLSLQQQSRLLADWPPAVLLALACACVDSSAQEVWIEITARKFL